MMMNPDAISALFFNQVKRMSVDTCRPVLVHAISAISKKKEVSVC